MQSYYICKYVGPEQYHFQFIRQQTYYIPIKENAFTYVIRLLSYESEPILVEVVGYRF